MYVTDSLLCEKGGRRRIRVCERPAPSVDDRGRARRAEATIAQVLGIVYAPSDLHLPPTLRVVLAPHLRGHDPGRGFGCRVALSVNPTCPLLTPKLRATAVASMTDNGRIPKRRWTTGCVQVSDGQEGHRLRRVRVERDVRARKPGGEPLGIKTTRAS